MEFCPKCGATMFPVDGVLTCNTCGYCNKTSIDEYTISEEIIPSETVKFIDKFDTETISIDTSIYKPRRFNKIKK